MEASNECAGDPSLDNAAHRLLELLCCVQDCSTAAGGGGGLWAVRGADAGEVARLLRQVAVLL